MSTENLRGLLYEKAIKEQSDFIEYLKTLPPEQIISHAYEKALRDDILMTFECDYLTDEQIMELVKLDKPLAACYKEWLNADCSYMDMLRETIERYANTLAEDNTKEHGKNEKDRDRER
ncbi:MAG: DUF3848 domain-containing protein [Clostridia bacterium]|nr:DUF3848 domain-containing protein [Clostridia bacterium]